MRRYLAAKGVVIDEMTNVVRSQNGYRFDVWSSDKPQFPPHFHVYFVNVKPTKANALATVKITSACPSHKRHVDISKKPFSDDLFKIADAVMDWLQGDDIVKWGEMKNAWNVLNPQNKVL